MRVTCDVSFSVGGALTGKWRVPEHPACTFLHLSAFGLRSTVMNRSGCLARRLEQPGIEPPTFSLADDLQSDEESVIFLRVTHETLCAYFVFSVSFSDQSLAK